MRIRTIKPEFWSNPTMGRASDSAKLMAIGLLNIADDKGYFYHDMVLIRNAVRPFDEDTVSTHGALTELAVMGYFEVRTHPKHGQIGWIESFLRHQVINRPSKNSMKELWDSSTPHGTLTESSVSTHPGKEGKGTGNGKERKGVEAAPVAVAPLTEFEDIDPFAEPAPEPTPKVNKAHGTLTEFEAFAEELGLPASDGAAMWHALESNGWKRGNAKLKDWRAHMRSWQSSGYHPSQKHSGPKPSNKPSPTKGLTEDIPLP